MNPVTRSILILSATAIALGFICQGLAAMASGYVPPSDMEDIQEAGGQGAGSR